MDDVFWISYHIADNPRYYEKYSKIEKEINKISEKQWHKGAFSLIQCPFFSIDAIAQPLAQILDSKTDTLLIRKLDKNTAVYFGNDDNFSEVKDFIPYVKRA